jgi:hypothetical protein
VTTLHSQAAKRSSKAGNQAGNRPYSIEPLSQQIITQPHLSQISRYRENSIRRGSQSSQFGPELGNSDRFSDDFILVTQY